MNREIKFRAWDRDTKYMLYNDIYPKTKRDWDLCEQSLDVMLGVIELDYDLMQCVGLKDKNGKEIYEGDILGILRVGNQVDIIGKIIFDTDLLSFTVEKVNGGWDYLTHFSSLEVIGNIYENPELVEGK